MFRLNAYGKWEVGCRLSGKWRRVQMQEVCLFLHRYRTLITSTGNIPRFVTNNSLASSISEDVPSFLKWMVKRFPEGGQVESHAVVPDQ